MSPYPNQLCQQLDPFVQHAVVHEQFFPQEYTVALRPVTLSAPENDIHTIATWMQQGYDSQQTAEQLQVMYIIIAESDSSQSFMVLLNHMPVGQLDIYQVSQDVLKDSYPSQPGDYRLHIPVIPIMQQHADLPVQVLQTCLAYFFSFPETERIVWCIHIADDACKSIALLTGFGLLHSFMDGDREMQVYAKQRLAS